MSRERLLAAIFCAVVLSLLAAAAFLWGREKPRATVQPVQAPTPQVDERTLALVRELLKRQAQPPTRETIIRERVVVQPSPPRVIRVPADARPAVETETPDRPVPGAERVEAEPLESEAAAAEPLEAPAGEVVVPLAVSELKSGGSQRDTPERQTSAPVPGVSLWDLLRSGPSLGVTAQRTDFGSRTAAGITFDGVPLSTYDVHRGEIRLPVLGRRLTTYGWGTFLSGRDEATLDFGPQASVGDRLRLGVALPVRQSIREKAPRFVGFVSYSF